MSELTEDITVDYNVEILTDESDLPLPTEQDIKDAVELALTNLGFETAWQTQVFVTRSQ